MELAKTEYEKEVMGVQYRKTIDKLKDKFS